MKNLREEFLKLKVLAESNSEMAINSMIDLFPEVSDSIEHDIYNSIIQWIGINGNWNNLIYLQKKDMSLFDNDCIDVLNELKLKINRRLENKKH